MRDLYLELILDGEIQLDFFEIDGRPILEVSYMTKELKESIDEEDLVSYITESISIATMCGFEAPSEYYRAMKDFIQDKTVRDFDKDIEEFLDGKTI